MSTPAYEVDFFRWATETARALREGRIADVDLAQVAEEIEDMGKKERRELASRLTVVLMHLLKWTHQPGRRSRSWRTTLVRQRQELATVLEESPSLRAELPEVMVRAYAHARLRAATETGLPEDTFPAGCPFTVDQALDPGHWPE